MTFAITIGVFLFSEAGFSNFWPCRTSYAQSGYGQSGYGSPQPAIQGTFTYLTGSELLDQAINCDYLIITHEDFFSTAALNDFANYRASYNQFRIVIAKVDDIYAQFPNSNGHDHSIKDFVQYAYDNWKKPPQYLLIVGDTEFVPSHQENMGFNNIYDYEEWYICVAGGDEWPDLAMGRFPVENEGHIRNIYNKIRAYEQNPVEPGDYHGRVLYVQGDTDSYLPNVIDIFLNAGFDVTELYKTEGNVLQDLIDAIDYGQNLVFWTGHGGADSYGWEFPFRTGDISSLNNDIYPIIFTSSCLTADLDSNSIGKELVRADVGAVAYYGATNVSWFGYAEWTLETIFENFEYNLGQAILLGETRSNNFYGSCLYILLGDPALQIFGRKLNSGLPDLAISSSRIDYDYLNEQLTFSVSNIGEKDAYNVLVKAEIVDNATGGKYPFVEYVFPMIPSGESVEAIINVAPPFLGEYSVLVLVDSGDQIEESFELNNQIVPRILIRPTFDDVTNSSGVALEGVYLDVTQADINGDGYPDIYFSGHTFDSEYNAKPKLYLNNGDGTFRDITDIVGVGIEGVKSAVFGDINNDGYPDLYVCRPYHGDRLFLNNGDWTNGDGAFEDITTTSGIDTYQSDEAKFADIDNDGDLDLYISDIYHDRISILLINKGNCTFETTDWLGDAPEYLEFVDIDSDGDLDLLAVYGTRVFRFYLNDGTGHFEKKPH